MARVEAAVRFIQAFLTLSVGITLVKLSGDSGGGDYFFTLVWLVLMGAAAPYLVAMSTMRRVGERWRLAIGLATILFGAVDAAARTQAFFFPTDRIGGGMALWLPIYAVGLIPLFAVILHTAIGVFTRERVQDEGRE
jgi:hypothetical protein